MDSRRTALITRASRGIGRAIAIELAANGYYTIINYRSNEQAARETLSAVQSNGGDGEIMCFDVAQAAQVDEAMKNIFSRFDFIEVLVNNAGITADNLFVLLSDEDWNSVIDTSLKGFFNMTKPVVKKMIRKKKGSIISISSVAGLIGNKGQANYAAAKAGLIGASKSLAMEIARLNIRVNVIAPGLIETDMIAKAPVEMIKEIIPMARIGKPEEIAKVVKFLCSDDASYITGQVISVNGGMF